MKLFAAILIVMLGTSCAHSNALDYCEGISKKHGAHQRCVMDYEGAYWQSFNQGFQAGFNTTYPVFAAPPTAQPVPVRVVN